MNKILILDIETTGFTPDTGGIVEIGIVELDLDNGERKIVFDQVCHESFMTKEHVEKAWIVKNSDLTVEDVRHSKNLNDIKLEVQEILDKYPLGATAFNNKFDFSFMDAREFVFPKKLACPMLLATPICQLPKARGFGYKWPKVEEAHKYFFGDVGYIEKHRGADDAFHEAEIVYELYKRGVFKVEGVTEN